MLTAVLGVKAGCSYDDDITVADSRPHDWARHQFHLHHWELRMFGESRAAWGESVSVFAMGPVLEAYVAAV